MENCELYLTQSFCKQYAIIDELFGKERFRYRAEKNTVKAYFAEKSDGGVVFEYQNKPIFFQFENQHQRSAKIDKNKIRYEKIYDNCDLLFSPDRKSTRLNS